jgi:hypothetical protein
MKNIFKIQNLLFIGMMVLVIPGVQAQNATTAAGGTATGPGGAVYYSVGQVFYSTVFSNGQNVRQGVEQVQNCTMTASLGVNRYVLYGALGYTGCSTLIPVITNGVAPYTYTWTSNDAGVNGATTASITPCNTQEVVRTYTVLVTGANGCQATATVNLTYININCSNNNNTVKVKVCHVPPGNPGNCNTICVSINAVQTLLNAGSYLGNCLPMCEIPPAGLVKQNISDYIIKPEIKSDPLPKDIFEVKISPNPTDNVFRIQVTSTSNEPVTVRILDLNGKVRSVDTRLSKSNIITVGGQLAGGTYMAEVMQGKNRKVFKLIKLN